MSPRRIRWAMRAVLYGTLAIVATLVLGMRTPDRPARTLEGETSQGYAVEVELAEDGTVQALSTRLRVPCSNGREDFLKWTAGRGSIGRFEEDGDRLRIVDDREMDADGWHTEGGVRVEADRAADGSLTGVAAASVRWTRPGHEGGSCRVAGVRWDASGR